MKLRLLEDLRLLVGIDLAGGYEVVERQVRVLSDDVIDFGGIGLEQ